MKRITIVAILSRFVRKTRMYFLHTLGYRDIDVTAIIESNVVLDKIYPQGVHIGANTLVGNSSIILTHEHIFVKPDGSYYTKDTYIGRNCFIGVRTLICPGVKIGDECVIGGGSVVTKDIPSNSMAVGVPAKVIKTGIQMDEHARLIGKFKYKE